MLDTGSSHEDLALSYRYAGFWRRFLALFIDGLILMIPNLIVNHILPFAGGVILFLFYKPVFESSSIRATPGKALMGMIVVGEDGSRLTYKQALIRSLMSIVSGMCAFIGYIMALFTERHQTLHDLVAHTIVLDHEMPSTNFFDIWLSEIKYIFGRGTSEILSSEPRASSFTHQGPTSFNVGVAPVTRSVDGTAVEALEKLHKLFTDGAITEAEFNAKKLELLKRI